MQARETCTNCSHFNRLPTKPKTSTTSTYLTSISRPKLLLEFPLLGKHLTPFHTTMSAFLHKQMAIMSCKKINKVLPGNVRQQLEQKLGHTFAKPDLLWEALQADGNGIGQIGDRKVENGNKKMAMLGDSVLQLAVLRDWFSSHESRSKCAKRHDLPNCILLTCHRSWKWPFELRR